MTTINILKLTAIFILVATIGYFINDYVSTKNELEKIKVENTLKDQNIGWYKDSLEMKAKIIQNYSIAVSDLNTQLKNSKTEYRILQSKYKIIFDSLHVLNGSAWVEFIDSSHLTISFKGDKKKIHYDGSVSYNIDNKKATHSITVIVDPVEIQSLIFADSLGKIRNIVFADSVLIDSAYTVIDESVYKLIAGKVKPGETIPEPYNGIWSKIKFGGSLLVGKDLTQFNVIGGFAPNNYIMLLGKYDLFNKGITVELFYITDFYHTYKLVF